ncbi:MAG: MerR family transcriptional regulator [Ancrocorticia sp.]|uniref:MerR family transcriptional regulator n=1 Tax=Ancrocorticia sp. TaxID=2593684 RepID=UPI003F904BBE
MTHTPNRDTTAHDMTVGEVADLIGVSVRTLHHWEAIGLITPSARTYAGYRLYDSADVERIHQILVYRETGMQLSQIAQVLDGSDATDSAEHLTRQRELLVDRITHLQEMVSAVDTMLEKKKMGIQLTPEEQVEVFGKDWNPEWEDQARQRWDDSEVWQQYGERTSKLTKNDLRRITSEIKAMESRLAQAKRDGVTPGSDEANELAEQHRASLDQWFDVPYARQVILARMYVEDPAFARHYNDQEPGLTDWLLTIVEENAAAHGLDLSHVEWQ